MEINKKDKLRMTVQRQYQVMRGHQMKGTRYDCFQDRRLNKYFDRPSKQASLKRLARSLKKQIVIKPSKQKDIELEKIKKRIKYKKKKGSQYTYKTSVNYQYDFQSKQLYIKPVNHPKFVQCLSQKRFEILRGSSQYNSKLRLSLSMTKLKPQGKQKKKHSLPKTNKL